MARRPSDRRSHRHLEITGVSLILAFSFGLISALCRLSDSYLARMIARGYLELIRNTPLLVQLFFIYFVMAPIFDLSRFASAVLALSLFEGAYASEIFRAGIVSIHKGQWEAAHSLGLSTFDTYRRIILPQAIRRILPPLTSQAISLVKDSALVSTIAVYDLTMRGREIISETFLAFEIWFTIAAIYLVVTVSLSIVVSRMERRFSETGYQVGSWRRNFWEKRSLSWIMSSRLFPEGSARSPTSRSGPAQGGSGGDWSLRVGKINFPEVPERARRGRQRVDHHRRNPAE